MDASKLKQYKQLLDEGIVTEEEFAAKKQGLLNEGSAKPAPAKPAMRPIQIAAIISAIFAGAIGLLMCFTLTKSVLLNLAYWDLFATFYFSSYALAVGAGIMIVLANVKPSKKVFLIASVILAAVAFAFILISFIKAALSYAELGYSFDLLIQLATEGFPQVLAVVAMILTLIGRRFLK